MTPEITESTKADKSIESAKKPSFTLPIPKPDAKVTSSPVSASVVPSSKETLSSEWAELLDEDELSGGKNTDIIVARKMVQLQQSAKSRGLKFDLSFNTVKRLLKQTKCYYTGVAFTKNGKNARSVDRVESDLGYIEGNVVVCTIDINGKKANLSKEDIFILAKQIGIHLANKKKRNSKKVNKKLKK